MKLTALQELENCALARMVDIYNGNVMTFDRTTQYKNIHKSLQALEIIKEKKVNVGYFIKFYKDKSYNEYLADTQFTVGKQISEIPLAKEEFDLLKEVLL